MEDKQMQKKIIQHTSATLSRVEREVCVSKRLAWLTGWNSPKDDLWDDLKKRGYLHGFGGPRVEGFRLVLDPDTGAVQEEPVLSFVLRGMTLKTAERVAYKHGQRGFIYKGPETEGAITLQGPDGTEESAAHYHPLIIAHYFARIVDAPFYFSNVRPRSWMEGLCRQVIKKREAEKGEGV